MKTHSCESYKTYCPYGYCPCFICEICNKIEYSFGPIECPCDNTRGWNRRYIDQMGKPSVALKAKGKYAWKINRRKKETKQWQRETSTVGNIKSNKELGLPELPAGYFFRIKDKDDGILGYCVTVKLKRLFKKKFLGMQFSYWVDSAERAWMSYEDDVIYELKQEGINSLEAREKFKEYDAGDLAVYLCKILFGRLQESIEYRNHMPEVVEGLGELAGDHPQLLG